LVCLRRWSRLLPGNPHLGRGEYLVNLQSQEEKAQRILREEEKGEKVLRKRGGGPFGELRAKRGRIRLRPDGPQAFGEHRLEQKKDKKSSKHRGIFTIPDAELVHDN